MIRRILFNLFLLCAVLVTSVGAEERVPCAGEELRPKKDGISLYNEASVDSGVVATINLGARLCSVGVTLGFAIIPRKEVEQVKSAEGFVYVRLVDVFRGRRAFTPEGKLNDGEAALEKVKRFYRQIESGTMPEDPLLPYRPVIDLLKKSEQPSSSSSSSSAPADQ